MLTTFRIEKRNLKGLKKLVKPFIKDKLLEDYGEEKNLIIRQMVYISYNDKINWKVVKNRAGYQSKCLVCSENISFPINSRLQRFVDSTFAKIMTNNFALSLLKTMENPEKLKIVYYDIDGNNKYFLNELCKLTDNFIVVTVNKKKYKEISDKLMDEMGVSLVYTDRLSRMKDADLVIAPTQIRKILDLNCKAIVLTSERPCFDMNAQCYYGYSVEIPENLEKYRPEDMDSLYFASALFSKGRQHYMAELIPKTTYNENCTCTVKSMGKYLAKAVV